MARVRTCEPPPQPLEHDAHADQGPAWQAGKHTCVLQARDCNNASHALPLLAGAVTTLRVAVCTPPPHVFEHEDQSDQSPKTQSTGHGCVLHDCDCAKVGHSAPP